MRRTTAVVVGSLIALGIGALCAPGTAHAAPGFDVDITELPGEFTAGRNPSTVTVVASTDRGRRCQKVRWSMLMTVDGVSLDQVRVRRVEDSGSVPLDIEAQGDTARLTDTEFDPGELCQGRTVTARYQIAFAEGASDGRVTLQAQAFDRNEQLLQEARATRDVLAGNPSAIPSADPSPSPSPGADVVPSAEPGSPSETASVAPARSSRAIASVPSAKTGQSGSLLGVGIIVGAILIFLGVSVLIRLRMNGQGLRLPRFRSAP